jgi:hypothetical protein
MAKQRADTVSWKDLYMLVSQTMVHEHADTVSWKDLYMLVSQTTMVHEHTTFVANLPIPSADPRLTDGN